MSGHKPPRHDPEGSWGEVFVMTKIAFQVLAGPLAVISAFVVMVVFTMWALLAQPILALLPIAIIALSLTWIARRDKREHKTLEEELLGPGRRL